MPDRYYVQSVEGGYSVYDRRSGTPVPLPGRHLTETTTALDEAENYARKLNEAYKAVGGGYPEIGC